MIRTNYPLKKFLQKNAKQNKLAFFVSEAQNKFVDKTWCPTGSIEYHEQIAQVGGVFGPLNHFAFSKKFCSFFCSFLSTISDERKNKT
jgi:hypothetical protein